MVSEVPPMPEHVRVAAYRAEPRHDLNAALDATWRAAYQAGYLQGRDDEGAGDDLPLWMKRGWSR